MKRDERKQRRPALERQFEPMPRIRSDNPVTGVVLPLLSNGELEGLADRTIGHRRLALAVNSRRLEDRPLVNDQGKKRAVKLPDFDTHLVCYLGSDCEKFEAEFQRELEKHPDIEAARETLEQAERDYRGAQKDCVSHWRANNPEYKELEERSEELEKDIRALNMRTKEGRRREREKRRELYGIANKIDAWRDAWFRANPGEKDIRPLRRALDDAERKLGLERRKRMEQPARRTMLVGWLAEHGVPNTDELDVTFHVSGTGAIGHDRNVKLYQLPRREKFVHTDVLGVPFTADPEGEDVTVDFPLNHIWEALRDENRNKLYRPGTHGFFVYAPQLPRNEWAAGGESKEDTVKNLFLYNKVGNILIGCIRKEQDRERNREHVYGWALLIPKEHLVDILISQDYYRNRFATVPAELIEQMAEKAHPESKLIARVRKLVDPETGRAKLPQELVTKLAETLEDEPTRKVLEGLLMPSLAEQFAAVTFNPAEAARERRLAEKRAAKEAATTEGGREEDAPPETVAAVPHPSSAPPSEPGTETESGAEDTPEGKAEAKASTASTPALN